MGIFLVCKWEQFSYNEIIKTNLVNENHYHIITMATLTPRSTISTTLYSRDPVGRKYLATEDWKIITTEDWKWIIAIDYEDTVLTARPVYEWQTWDDLGSQTWDDVWTMTWNDLFTWPVPTVLTGRTIPN